jgi:peptidoglycan/xylan/chitin deacetylase (PgdA/CDA1 family)
MITVGTETPLASLRNHPLVNRSLTAIAPTADRLLRVWRPALTDGLTVFFFHEVTSRPSAFHVQNQTWTHPDLFRRQVSWIADRFSVVEPGRLKQLGGTGKLPTDAAILTFDDSWAGVFRVALPILREMGLPAICFLNMATVDGQPDLAVVRSYDVIVPEPLGFGGARSVDLVEGRRLIDRIWDRYGGDNAFRDYQGPTADRNDLERASKEGGVWFGSHLFHHWDLRLAAEDLFEQSLAENRVELANYPNVLPAFATPYGYAGEDGRDPSRIPLQQGIRVTFTGRCTQNREVDGPILDRLSLPPTQSPRAWWHATHLARVLGPRANRLS